ncbi:tetratricopeptide repeat protein, partial [Alphaproteobacteria bacterium]|nr:tetratricopeptide repeat protein [Alphaproteobacteria bacterium]
MGSDDDKEDKNYVKGKELIQSGNYNEAISALEASLEKKSDDSDALNLIGFSYRKLENYEKAFEYYNKALKIDPKHKGAMEYMGIAYLETGQLQKAENLFEKLKEICSFCKERKSLDKAIKAFKRN